MGMLILTRYKDEEVEIYHKGEKLLLKITKTSSSKCSVAFEGDRSFVIVRPDAKKKYREEKMNGE